MLPLCFAGSRTVVDQFGSDVVSFQVGDPIILVLGAIEFDRRATIRIKNHQDGAGDLIARPDFAGLVGIALQPCKLPKTDLGEWFTAHLAPSPSESWRCCGEFAIRAKILVYVGSAGTTNAALQHQPILISVNIHRGQPSHNFWRLAE